LNFNLSIFVSALGSPSLVQGAWLTILLTIVSFGFGLAIGLVVAVARDNRYRVIRALAWGYVWVFRAVPTIVQLLFVWNALPQMIPALKGSWFTPFMAATLALSLNEGAYAAEIVRGGLLAIDDGQKLAARALGLSPFRTFRRVIAPQLVRVIIPPISNDFITLLKITSLAYIISLRELVNNAQLAIASTFRFAEWYAAVAVYFLVIVSIFMFLQSLIEKRFVWTSRGNEPGAVARIRSGVMR